LQKLHGGSDEDSDKEKENVEGDEEKKPHDESEETHL